MTSRPSTWNDPSFDPPDRTRRAVCWDARDAFFGCLNRNDIVSGESRDAAAKCSAEKAVFEEKCIQSWVKYFQDKRLFDLRKEDKIRELKAQGAKEMPS